MPKPVANGTHTPHASGLNEICNKLANIIIKIFIDKHVYKFCNAPFFQSDINTTNSFAFGLAYSITHITLRISSKCVHANDKPFYFKLPTG